MATNKMILFNSADFHVQKDKELIELLNDLSPDVQKKVIFNAFRASGYIIIRQAKSNFNSVKKHKSLTNYAYVNKAFVVKQMKKKEFGFIVGVRNYKLGWINWGTEERKYNVKYAKKTSYFIKKQKASGNSIKSTGSIKKTNFFYNAVESKKKEAMDSLNNNIIKSMEKTVKKYNSK